LVNGFMYVAKPVITAVTPSSGPTAGGTTVTLTGSGFMTGSIVKFGGNPATVISNSGTTMVVKTPPGTAGPKDVSVANPHASSVLTGGFTYVPAPTISSVVPTTGPTSGGTTVVITGTGFNPAATVSLGDAGAGVTDRSGSTSITITTPAGSVGPRDVKVTNPDGQVATAAGAFTYVEPPIPTPPPGPGPATPSDSATPRDSASPTVPATTAPAVTPDPGATSTPTVGQVSTTVSFKGSSTKLRTSQKKRIRALIAKVPKGATVKSALVHSVLPTRASKSVTNRSKVRSGKVAAYLRGRGMPNTATAVGRVHGATGSQMRSFIVTITYLG
jgi:hypothetical protein